MWVIGICELCRAVVCIKKPMRHVHQKHLSRGYLCPVCFDGKLIDTKYSFAKDLDTIYNELKLKHTTRGDLSGGKNMHEIN